jgi:hypothetical protein
LTSGRGGKKLFYIIFKEKKLFFKKLLQRGGKPTTRASVADDVVVVIVVVVDDDDDDDDDEVNHSGGQNLSIIATSVQIGGLSSSSQRHDLKQREYLLVTFKSANRDEIQSTRDIFFQLNNNQTKHTV